MRRSSKTTVPYTEDRSASRMAPDMDTVFKSGLMAPNTKDTGRMISKMEKESTQTCRVMSSMVRIS